MTDDNIQRLINNQKSEHTPHAFAGNRSGMGDFNLLYPVLTKVPAVALRKWMRMIDAMRATHGDCAPCYAKILAYSILFTQDHAPKLCERYQQLYTPFVARNFIGRRYRDIMGEVKGSLQGTGNQPVEIQSANSRAPIMELLGLMKDDDEEDPGLRKRR